MEDTEWEFETWFNIPWVIGIGNVKFASNSVEDTEWEFENRSNIPSKIRNWNSKLGSIFLEG
jgi:hypothetical protein